MGNETEEDDNNVPHDDANMKIKQGNNTIFDACKGGEDNYRLLKKMIEQEVDVNQRNEQGETPLSVAVCTGDLYAMDALINAGANVELGDKQQMTPLMVAAQLGFDSKLAFLLKKDANPMAVDKTGQTALHKTIRNKETKCAVSLIDQCSDLVHVKDRMDQTVLHFAAGEGNNELIDVLIGYGADVDLVDRLGRAPLHWAILQSMDESAKKIGGHGRNGTLDTQDKLGMAPLHYALQQNNNKISTNLINQGCDVDAVDARGQSGLVYASASGKTDMCGKILENSKNKNSVDKKGWTALHHAAHKNHADICSFLLDHGIDGDFLTVEGHTALVLAVINENVDTVKLLCEKMDGWTLTKDEKGRYPIHYAAESGFDEILEILIKAFKHKCDTDPTMKEVICTPDASGVSALQMAAIPNFKKCCQLLLDNDADIEDNIRPHLVRMGLIENTPKDEEKKEESDVDEKEEPMTPMERYAPPTSTPSTASSDDVKSMNLNELLNSNASAQNENRKEKQKNQSNGKQVKEPRKGRKYDGRKSPYLQRLVPPEILKKYSTGYLPQPNKSRLSGRLSSTNKDSSTMQCNENSGNTDGQRPCRLRGTLDQRKNTLASRPSWKYSYSLNKR